MMVKIATAVLLSAVVVALGMGASETSPTTGPCVIHYDAQFIVCADSFGTDYYILKITAGDYVHLAAVHAFYSDPKDRTIDTIFIPLDVFRALAQAFSTLDAQHAPGGS